LVEQPLQCPGGAMIARVHHRAAARINILEGLLVTA
jgi:hypothetical protein